MSDDRIVETLSDIQQVFTRINLSLPAGSPMVFACDQCGEPMWVPEMYVAKPRLCEPCGGEWCQR